MLSRTARALALVLPVFFTLLSGSAKRRNPRLTRRSIRWRARTGSGKWPFRRMANAWRGLKPMAAPRTEFLFAAWRRRLRPGATSRRAVAMRPRTSTEIAWSPDSRQLAFLSNAQTPDQLQLYVANVTGGEARKLTDLKGSLDAPSWSP